MPWHLLISGQPAEERHPRRQARIRGRDPGFNASQRPLLADGNAHSRTAAQSAHSPGESVPALLYAIRRIIVALASLPGECRLADPRIVQPGRPGTFVADVSPCQEC